MSHLAILGCGGMGRTVAKHLVTSGGVAPQAVIAHSLDAGHLDLARRELGVRTTSDLASILGDPQVGLVYVTAANDAHLPLVRAALEAGKAVMCEKPIANSLADAEAMVALAERRGLFLQIGFELRYSQLYATVKDWIDQGLLGEVVNTRCTYYCSEFWGRGSWRSKLASGGSLFGEKVSHYVDLPRWWLGRPVEEVQAVCAPNVVPYFEVHDNYHAIYRFAGGAVSQLSFQMFHAESFHGDPLKDSVGQQADDGHELRYLVTGRTGAAETDVFRRRVRRWEFADTPGGFTSRLAETLTWEQPDDHRQFHNTEGQTLDILHRVRAGLPPRTPARDALETMRLCFAADESVACGRPVRLAAPAG